jgi:hypothetical protein
MQQAPAELQLRSRGSQATAGCGAVAADANSGAADELAEFQWALHPVGLPVFSRPVEQPRIPTRSCV